MAAVYDAERRMSKGEKQIRCPSCGLWIWESFYTRRPKPLRVQQTGPASYQVIDGDSMDEIIVIPNTEPGRQQGAET